MGRQLRAFYHKSDNQIVWYHETRSPEGMKAVCPTTIKADLAGLPNKKPDGKTPLGGLPEDYRCIKVDSEVITAYFKSDDNKIIENKVVVGQSRVEVPQKVED